VRQLFAVGADGYANLTRRFTSWPSSGIGSFSPLSLFFTWARYISAWFSGWDAVQIALEYEAFQNGRRKWGLIKPVRMQTEVETDYEISSSRNQYLSGQIDDIAGRLCSGNGMVDWSLGQNLLMCP
jgi:hypothetical protein